LVRAANERYAIPLTSIREVTTPTASDVRQREDRTVLQIGEEVIDLFSLHHLLHRESVAFDPAMPIVIVRTAVGPVGLAVDELLGRQEIVVKTLGSLKALEGSCYGGATIDPEGRVILVLDPSRLLAQRSRPPAVRGLSSETSGKEDEPAGESGQHAPSSSAILLIDDSLSIRKFVGKMLESAGYQVDTAIDGEDGIRKASARSYRLIITDLEMPKFNGFEVIQTLRSRPQTQQTPIVVMTTRAGDKHRQISLDVGANSHIGKPVDERTLLQEVQRWMRHAPAMRK
jgi:chemosensory pili system protein ChpA (sensor histidine kinase/response regulator)